MLCSKQVDDGSPPGSANQSVRVLTVGCRARHSVRRPKRYAANLLRGDQECPIRVGRVPRYRAVRESNMQKCEVSVRPRCAPSIDRATHPRALLKRLQGCFSSVTPTTFGDSCPSITILNIMANPVVVTGFGVISCVCEGDRHTSLSTIWLGGGHPV